MKAAVIGAVLLATASTATTAGAALYDRSSPLSTGCNKRGLVDEARTVRTYGAWNVRIVRSTGCNTAWALVTRTDGKRCQPTTNCARIRITRIRADGVKVTSARKQVAGTTSQYSLQFGAVVGARYTASASTFGGSAIGDSAALRYNADGTWTLA